MGGHYVKQELQIILPLLLRERVSNYVSSGETLRLAESGQMKGARADRLVC